MKALVTYAKKVDFVNRETGERIQQAKVQFLNLEQEVLRTDTEQGIPENVLKSQDFSLLSHFPKIPAVYDVNFVIATDGKGNPVMKFSNAKFVKEYSFAI